MRHSTADAVVGEHERFGEFGAADRPCCRWNLNRDGSAGAGDRLAAGGTGADEATGSAPGSVVVAHRGRRAGRLGAHVAELAADAEEHCEAGLVGVVVNRLPDGLLDLNYGLYRTGRLGKPS